MTIFFLKDFSCGSILFLATSSILYCKQANIYIADDLCPDESIVITISIVHGSVIFKSKKGASHGSRWEID